LRATKPALRAWPAAGVPSAELAVPHVTSLARTSLGL